jgi:CheY-like chemotaxis protein
VDPGAYVCLSVSDAGAGISPDMADQIFEPFFTTKEDDADGLGLAVVYGIIQQAGGNVKVYSELGVGTTLKVYVPAQNAPVGDARSGSESRVEAGPRTETVLLAEDEHGVRSVIARMLTKNGFKVLEATDGQEALDILETGRPVDLIVTDIVMPNMTGDRLADAVARIHPGAKILLMSGYTRELVVKQGLAGRHFAFIQKPFTPTRFLNRVLTLLDTGK